EYVLALPQGNLRYVQMQQMASAMAQTDPKGALAAVDQLPEKDRSAVTCDILEAWTQKDSAAAIDAGGAFAGGEGCCERASSKERKEVMTQILAKWARSNPDAALEWTAARPDASEFRDVIQYLARESTGNEPEKAISRLEHFPIDVQRVAVA